MAAANVIVKCEEYLENEAHMGDINGCYNYQYLGQENQGGNDSDSGEDDQKMSELLREFDLEVLYAVLKCADITYRSLKYISENDINTAIRSIAYRAEFREKLFAWRRDKFGLNDYFVLPSQRTNIVTPLGTNNDANIMTTEASSRQTSFCPSNPTSNKEATAKIARTRLPSTPKTCAAKIPRLSKETPASSGFTQLHQAQPQSFAPASPKACNAMVAASPMTTPTPCDTLSFMQSENTANPVLDYDDPLCFQPTTSSAAAAAAVTSANAAADAVSAQPQMNLEKLINTTAAPPPHRTSYYMPKNILQTGKHFLAEDFQGLETEIGVTLPFSCIADVYDFDERLKDEEFAIAMKCYLSKLKGMSSTIDEVFKKVIDDRCVEEFNWDGRSGKRAMSKLFLFSEIFCDIFYTHGRKEVEKQLRRSVELSHNRVKQKRHLQKKKEFSRIF